MVTWHFQVAHGAQIAANGIKITSLSDSRNECRCALRQCDGPLCVYCSHLVTLLGLKTGMSPSEIVSRGLVRKEIPMFGPAKNYLKLIGEISPIASRHEYFFVSDEWFAEFAKSNVFSPEKVNPIIARERFAASYYRPFAFNDSPGRPADGLCQFGGSNCAEKRTRSRRRSGRCRSQRRHRSKARAL